MNAAPYETAMREGPKYCRHDRTRKRWKRRVQRKHCKTRGIAVAVWLVPQLHRCFDGIRKSTEALDMANMASFLLKISLISHMNKLILKAIALCYLVLIGDRCFTSFPN